MAVMFFAGLGFAKSDPELWKLKLTDEGGIETFERHGTGIWAFQQGVVFLTPDRLLIYQVRRTLTPSPQAKRDVTGGSGNYFIIARLFDAHTGHELKRLSIPTSAEYSAIIPTHDGKFLVRAGNFFGLYSSDFGLLHDRELPPGTKAQLITGRSA